jgi:hypothetical protein
LANKNLQEKTIWGHLKKGLELGLIGKTGFKNKPTGV